MQSMSLLCAAGRLLIEEARALIDAGKSFAIESTLSGKTYVALIKLAKEQGYQIVIHFVVLDSPSQAIRRVAARVGCFGAVAAAGECTA